MHRPPRQLLPRQPLPGLLLCLLLGAAASMWTAPARAAPAHYALDPVHTRVTFAIDHAGFSKAIGTVSGSTGTLLFDPDDWSLARVEATIPLDRLDLGDAAWNRATLARNLLDADAYPVATFVSTRVVPVDAGRAVVHGLLTLRGVTREVELQVVHNALRRHPLPPFRRTVGFSATAVLSRSDFGMTAWRSVIGDAVELRIEVEATRARGGVDADDGQAQDPTFPDDGDVDPSRNDGADDGTLDDSVPDDSVPDDGMRIDAPTDPREPARLPSPAPEPLP